MMKIDYVDGATPLTNDELLYLIPECITTQEELNSAEQLNIANSQVWLLSKNLSIKQILTENFLKDLHKKMYGAVWKWAGKYRQSDKNIGTEWIHIPVKLHQLFNNTLYQIKHKTYPHLEIAMRFHHQLVWIHLFPNGNGRHARILTDFLLKQLNEPTLNWGGINIKNYAQASKIRAKYIAALRSADKGDYQKLLDFSAEKT